jgi:lysophospholipase L1-like esterase
MGSIMNIVKTLSILSLAALAASLSACGGSGVGGALGPAPAPGKPLSTNVTQRIVGLGDSLTFGEQSEGMLGSTSVSLAGDVEFTSIGLNTIPPTQENGFFSLLYSDANGMTWVQQATPGISVLPLINGPGLGDQILPANPADTGGIPFATVPGRSSCDSFNQSAYAWGTAGGNLGTTVRMNPTSTTYDLGIPSLTLAEAIGMIQPQAPTCKLIYPTPSSAAQAAIDSLQALVGGESGLFYPVMEKYASPTHQISPLQAAEELNPTLTTVWLGANDLLRYIFSGGTAPGVDTTSGQVQSHMTTIIKDLKHVGSNVVVATIPNVLETPQFAIVGNPPSQAVCQIQTWLPCIIYELGFEPTFADAEAYTSFLESSDTFLAPSGSQNAYLTESGLIALVVAGGNPAAFNANENGSFYLTASFASQVQSVNTAINNGIVAAASANSVPAVRIDQIMDGIYSGSGPYFAQAASINPPKCCTLAFGGGVLSLDGLHPSDTGYALVAEAFVQTINTAFGTSLPAIAPASAYTGAGGIYASYPDPYAQH